MYRGFTVAGQLTGHVLVEGSAQHAICRLNLTVGDISE